MARLTSQVAAQQVGNLYDLVLIASRRVRELHNGYAPHVNEGNGPVVTAIREVEAGHVGREYLTKNLDLNSDRRKQRQ